MAAWQKVATGLDHGGCFAWEEALAATVGDHGRDHLPVFVVLCQPSGSEMTLAQAIAATLALPDIRLGRHERDLLVTELGLAGQSGWPHEVRTVAFCPRARLGQLPAFWRVVQVGPGLAMPPDPDDHEGMDLCATVGDLDPRVPLAAVIDDGIAFLNARFRQVNGRTRIKALWLQAPERVADSGAAPARDVVCGRVLDEGAINALLAEARQETEVYAKVNRDLLAVTDGALTNRRTAHGTHVLDLVAGTSPVGDALFSQVPILAVQLPAAAVRETAGRRMEACLVQGLRWILAESLRLARGTDVPPVVINLSLGSFAGPGDRHAFLADWFTHEIARHARLGKGAKLRLVIAYGNARQGRLVARAELRRWQPMELVWRVQPDDHSSSFLECRVDTNMVSGLRLTLGPPPGSGLPALDIPWPEAGTGWRLAGPIAAVTAVAEPGGQSLLHLALGPTVGLGVLPACPPGAWSVTLRATEAEPVRLTARVQRDDTPPGYRTLGRQSWLDHPLGWDWDVEARGYVAPRAADDAPGCPVTREGSCVAYAGADDPAILFVGAVRPTIGQPGQVLPTAYSSEGVVHLARPGESPGPTLVALGDDGLMLPGKRAAGVVSGSVTRMSGTSMAAPQVARALLHHFLATPPAGQSPEAESQALTGSADWQEPDRRTGRGVLIA